MGPKSWHAKKILKGMAKGSFYGMEQLIQRLWSTS